LKQEQNPLNPVVILESFENETQSFEITSDKIDNIDKISDFRKKFQTQNAPSGRNNLKIHSSIHLDLKIQPKSIGNPMEIQNPKTNLAFD